MENKKISFIIPVYKTEQYLERCLLSLTDQDWINKEIICILDGENKKCEEIINNVIKKSNGVNIKYKVIEHGGACKARNEGAKLATGDIWSFFNSDYNALPGMIRTWMEAFEDNPDCDFVYGGYGWIPREYKYYASEDFDAYKLESYNYIDCGNPIKKEIFQPWDDNCKSLQDWDFFLRLVKSGAKGKYLGPRNIVYEAEIPRSKGLSDDSSSNWLERVAYVKKNHGITDKSICVSSLGAPKHGVNVAKLLNADFKPYPSFKPQNYKMVYLIGFYKSYAEHAKVFANLNKDCVKVIHWVGADIYWLRDLKFAEIKYFMQKLSENIGYHLVECEQMQQEMADYGIKAEIVPIPPMPEYTILPLPDEFSVAVMKTEVSDFDKYLGDLMDEIMAAMPHVKFKVFGDGKCKRQLDNVENCGYVDMQGFMPKCSCFLRIVKHDGMMMAANEFVMAGRDAITNLKMPYMEFIDTSVDPRNWDKFSAGFNIHNYPETKAKIINKIVAVKNGLAGNKNKMQASDYYKKLLDKNVYKEKIYAMLQQKISK